MRSLSLGATVFASRKHQISGLDRDGHWSAPGDGKFGYYGTVYKINLADLKGPCYEIRGLSCFPSRLIPCCLQPACPLCSTSCDIRTQHAISWQAQNRQHHFIIWGCGQFSTCLVSWFEVWAVLSLRDLCRSVRGWENTETRDNLAFGTRMWFILGA